MTFSTRVFAKDSDGKLREAIISDATSYEEAINLMKDTVKAPRAMCIVDSTEITELKAAA
jgi:hypothetical protein